MQIIRMSTVQSREGRGLGPMPTHTRLLRRIADGNLLDWIDSRGHGGTSGGRGRRTTNSTRRRRRGQEQFQFIVPCDQEEEYMRDGVGGGRRVVRAAATRSNLSAISCFLGEGEVTFPSLFVRDGPSCSAQDVLEPLGQSFAVRDCLRLK